MKVARLLIYDMPEKQLESQLGRSMPDGLREFPFGSIRIITLPNRWGLLRLLRALWGKSSI